MRCYLLDCPIPHLYGLSLLRASLRVNPGDKVTGEVTPHFVDHPDMNRILPSDFLGGAVELDILFPDRLKKMQEIAPCIKAANVVSHDPDDEH